MSTSHAFWYCVKAVPIKVVRVVSIISFLCNSVKAVKIFSSMYAHDCGDSDLVYEDRHVIKWNPFYFQKIWLREQIHTMGKSKDIFVFLLNHLLIEIIQVLTVLLFSCCWLANSHQNHLDSFFYEVQLNNPKHKLMLQVN